MNNTRILITGANGFLGSHLVRYLREHYPHAKIAGILRTEKKDSQTIKTFIGDLSNQTFVSSVLSQYQPQFIFHLAGNAFSNDFTSLLQDNVSAFAHMAEAITALNLKTNIVITSTAAEYGYADLNHLPISESLPPAPGSLYGLTKNWQTMLAQYHAKKGINIKIARLFNIIGGNISEHLIMGSLLKQLNSQSPILKVGNVNSIRDFLDIHDICSALDIISQKGTSGEIYNVCSQQQTPISHLIECLQKEKPYITVETTPEKFKKNDISIIYGNNAKLQALGWKQTISLTTSIKHALTC